MDRKKTKSKKKKLNINSKPIIDQSPLENVEVIEVKKEEIKNSPKKTNEKTRTTIRKTTTPKKTTTTRTKKVTPTPANNTKKSSSPKVVIKDKEEPKEKKSSKKTTTASKTKPKTTTSKSVSKTTTTTKIKTSTTKKEEPKTPSKKTTTTSSTKIKTPTTKKEEPKTPPKKTATVKNNSQKGKKVSKPKPKEKEHIKNISNSRENLGIKLKNRGKKALNFLISKIKETSKSVGTKVKKLSKKTNLKLKDFREFMTLKSQERKIKNLENKLIKNNKKAIRKANSEIKKQTKENIKLNDYKVSEDREIKKQKKRKGKFKLALFIIFVIAIVVLISIPYGTTFYISDASGVTLEVPKMVKIKEECCNFSAKFSTFRSSWSLKNELNKMIDSYEVLNCDDKTYYYNRENNYTITDFGIIDRPILNEVYITYGKGNSCDIDTSFKKLELLDDDFSLNDAKKDGNYVIEGDNVYNKSAYDTFMKNVKEKKPSVLRIVTTNKEGDVLITDLEYLKNGKFMVTYDGTRDRNAKDHRIIVAYKYEHLAVTKNKLYAYNGDKIITNNPKKEQAFYLFTIQDN